MLLRILGLLVAVVLGAVHAFCCRGVGQANAGQAGSIRRRISCIRSVRDVRSVRSVRGTRGDRSVRGRGHAVRRGVEHQPLATRPIIAAESISNMSRGVELHLGKLGETMQHRIVNLVLQHFDDLFT